MELMEKLLVVIVILGMAAIIGVVVDSVWTHPIAKDNANIECKELGFDQVKGFSRIGLFSTTPVAIKCEYAERYSDLGVRTTATN